MHDEDSNQPVWNGCAAVCDESGMEVGGDDFYWEGDVDGSSKHMVPSNFKFPL